MPGGGVGGVVGGLHQEAPPPPVQAVRVGGQIAIDAVRQWSYTPTLLNGIPVSVIVTVTVQFVFT